MPMHPFLSKLLDGEPVDWVPLGDLTTLKRGRVISKKYLTEHTGNFPVYSSQTAKNGVIGKLDTFDFDGEYISWTTDGANAGTVFYRTGKFSITNVCGLIKINEESRLNYKFLFYWLSIAAQKHVSPGMGNPKLMSHQVQKISIPLPSPNNPQKSRAIQAEIVRILDKFTALNTALNTELRLRQKQYRYYRERLLNFDPDQVTWVPLGEVAEIQRGTAITKKRVVKGSVPVIAGGRKPAYYHNESNRTGQSIVISASGAYAGFVSWWEEPIFVSDAFTVKPHKHLLPKYCFYLLQRMQQKLHDFKSGGGVPHVYPSNIAPLKIPLPCPNNPQKSQAIQGEIVRILDKFTALNTALNTELRLRQKQYTYYRDLLLNFQKPREATA